MMHFWGDCKFCAHNLDKGRRTLVPDPVKKLCKSSNMSARNERMPDIRSRKATL